MSNQSSSTQSLSSVTHDVVEQYAKIGKIVSGTYRSGVTRLLTGAHSRYVSFLGGRMLPLVGDSMKTSLIGVQKRMARAIEGGIVAGTGRVDQVIDLVSGSVNGGITRIAATVGRVESTLKTTAISKVAKLALPVAEVSLTIANRAVDGTKGLSARAIGVEDEVSDAVATTEHVARRAPRKRIVAVKNAVGTNKRSTRTAKSKSKARA